MNILRLLFITLTALIFASTSGETELHQRFMVEIEARDSFERSLIAESGAAIEQITDDHVLAIVTYEELESLKKHFNISKTTSLDWGVWQFPPADEAFHDYFEVLDELENLQQEFPHMIRLSSIGKTVEGRDIWAAQISENIHQELGSKPAAIFMGGHHAREHLSVEVPLRITKWMMRQYAEGNPRIKELLATREYHLIPMINPDGLEYDIEGGRYKTWRKNRRLNPNRTYGVDLNRNYSFKWGTGGASSNPSSETFRGPQPFSEPETQAVKTYLESNRQITIVLSYHTFSELILYPWGHTKDPIANPKDQKLYETLAAKMAEWTKYKPMSSSGLYIASGDLTDWSYGELGMISFTFELDPKQSGFGGAGFYPGAKAIEPAVQKNIEPALYLLGLADNPYRALE